MRKKRERKHRSKMSNSVTLSPCLLLSSSLEQKKTVNDELSEKRVNLRKERSRLAAQIRRNREGQSLMLIQNALPISSHVLGLNLVQQNSKSSNSINGTKKINQSSENNNVITSSTIGRGQKKTTYSNSSVSNTMTEFLTTTSTATITEISSSTISNIPSAINLEKTRVLRIAGHTLFLLNKLSSYLRLQAKLCLSLNSQSLYGMLIDAKEMRIAYVTPALAKATGWSWIKLLGAPLHKLIKSTGISQNSTETHTKLSSKSQYSPLISSSHFNKTMKTSITCSSYPIHETSCTNLTSINNNDEYNNNITDNEFILPEFITLLKSNSNEQHLLCTSKNNKLDERILNSSLILDNNINNNDIMNTIFSDINDINRNEFTGTISKSHRIIHSDLYYNNKMKNMNKCIRKSSSTPLISSKLELDRFIPGNNMTNIINSSIDNNNNCNSDDQLNTKSFPQNNNDNELICYCWSNLMINTFTDNSTGFSEILNSLDECNVNNSSTDDSNFINGDDDDGKSLINNELLDILMKDSFSQDSLTFESSCDNSYPFSIINNPCNSCDSFDEINSTLSTGLYLCLLQPVCNKTSSFDDLTNHVYSISNDNEYNHNNTISNDSNDNNIGGDVNQNNLLDSSVHLLEDSQKSVANDKQDSSISCELHKNINIRQSDESLTELSNVDTTSSSSLLNVSTSMKIPSLEQNKECIQSKSFQCHIYLNCALTIKMVQGNYTDCFDIEDQSGIINYSYLEFIHPDDLQNVITIFTRIIRTNSPAWISPYRVSVHNKMVNNNTEKSYRWTRSLVSYNKMKNIFICSSQFLGLCELYTCAVGSNQRLLSVTFELSVTQFELKLNNTINDNYISSQNIMKPFKCNSSNECSINRRYHQQLKSKQVRISNSSFRPVRLKKSSTSLVIKNSNIIKPIKLFPFQSTQYIKQQSGQGYNQISSIRLLSLNNNGNNNNNNNNNNKVPCLSHLNSHLYDTTKANDNRQINSVLNISITKSLLHHSPSNISSVPYYVKSMLPVVNYTSLSSSSSPSKKLIFLSSTSSLPSTVSTKSIMSNKLQTFNTSNISKNKLRNDDKRDKYIEYSAICQDNNPITLHNSNNNIHSSSYSQINDLYNQMVFAHDNNKTLNPMKLTVKPVCNDHQWKSGDNWSSSLTDNSSPHSVYSSHGSTTSIDLSPNEQNLTDLSVGMQMEATVSELLESIPLSNKLSYDNDGVQMHIDFNGNSYDSNIYEYEDSELLPLDSDFESNENFTGFQPDLIPDSNCLSSPV
ncbi:unnamed protein product [Schistosoma margrebowiei]|uniref:Uncharacterized protein n=1 Tax=Schistosoma margrebowiei TaxID=48269 RepID=A0A183MJA0_9TREM|nr:unnamed protein product [Schistosoma margrebowiei]